MRKISTLAVASTIFATGAFAAGEVSFNGFISNGYLHSSDNNYLANTEDGSWEYMEAGVNATWSPFDRAVLRGQLFTFELGDYGNFDPIVDYLFFDYNFSPMFGLQVGRIKRPHGIYNDIQDIDIARTSVLLPTVMYDQRYRDFSAYIDGLAFYGNIPAGQSSSFDYLVYHGKMEMGTEGGLAGSAITVIGRNLLDPKVDSVSVDSNSGLQIWWNTPVSGLRMGVSHILYKDLQLSVSATIPYYNIPFHQETLIDVNETRLSTEYYVGDWTLTGEFNNQDTDSRVSQSWYLGASRRFADKFEAGVTYGESFGNKDIKDDSFGFHKDLQFSLRYNATSYWSLMTELHFMDGRSNLFNQLGQNPNPADEGWTLFAAKSTFTF